MLEKRGDLPSAVVARVRAADELELDRMVERLLDGGGIDDWIQ